MKDMTDKAKAKTSEAARALKTAAENVAGKTKDAARKMGTKMEEGGRI